MVEDAGEGPIIPLENQIYFLEDEYIAQFNHRYTDKLGSMEKEQWILKRLKFLAITPNTCVVRRRRAAVYRA